jgi:ATP-dependent DNA helicase RecG
MSTLWEKLDLPSEEALLFHFPRRHEDRARWADPFLAAENETVTARGTILGCTFNRWGYRQGKCTATLQLHNDIRCLQLVWFNSPWMKRNLPTGKELIVFGKVTRNKGDVILNHPEMETVVEDGENYIHLNRITPVYPLREKVYQRVLRRALFRLVSETNLHEVCDTPSPDGLMDIAEALYAIHFPESFAQLEAARERIAYEELLHMQLLLARRRRRIQALARRRNPQKFSLVGAFLQRLPYPLTGAQQRACAEIDRDLEQPHPMNRLLQGDVGSGKTWVAVHAMLRALERGENAALLAPTEILARQHEQNIRRLLEGMGVDVLLWTRTQKPEEAPLLNRAGRLYIGTHALIQEKAGLPNLGLGVIDEQHRFGVEQRHAFQSKGLHPDMLLMSATPIPRTLGLTLYGDLDASILDERPPGRRPVKTALRSRAQLPKVWEFLRAEIAAGRQAFCIYPLIDDSEKLEAKSIKSALQELEKEFQPGQVRMLHGRLKAEEKDRIMESFRRGEFPVLASTTVVEVGVDIPNASAILIENAERFGLAQLHQLRGRVGRGEHKSWCILISDPEEKESWERLQAMEKLEDGFALAEEDLRLRGHGNLLGTEQSGLPPLRVARLPRDYQLLLAAHRSAEDLAEKESRLGSFPKLQAQIEQAEKALVSVSVN